MKRTHTYDDFVAFRDARPCEVVDPQELLDHFSATPLATLNAWQHQDVCDQEVLWVRAPENAPMTAASDYLEDMLRVLSAIHQARGQTGQTPRQVVADWQAAAREPERTHR